MRYLFVGGPRHGEQIEIPDNRAVILMPDYPERMTAKFLDDSHIDDYRIRTVDYQRTDIGSDRIVYVARRTNR